MATEYVLDGYMFERNPKEMDIPREEKTVAEVKTYAGSAVFQWDPTIVGKSITLSWPAMSAAMYEQLWARYISTATMSFNPQGAYIYQVIVTGFTARYFKYYDGSFQYLKDVELTLNIRSFTAS